jgi:purine-nucleoside phosphorylase
MGQAYSANLRGQAFSVAAPLGVRLKEGVYAAVSGPSYETPAEVRMIGLLGGDAVGMSTVPEVIAARHMGLSVLGISCITNLAAGRSQTPLEHEEVTRTAERVRDVFSRFVLALAEGLDLIQHQGLR